MKLMFEIALAPIFGLLLVVITLLTAAIVLPLDFIKRAPKQEKTDENND